LRSLRHGHIDVDLSASSAEQSASPREHGKHNHNYEDHEHCNNTSAVSAITIVSHSDPSREIDLDFD
jgi:hypothetical protein